MLPNNCQLDYLQRFNTNQSIAKEFEKGLKEIYNHDLS